MSKGKFSNPRPYRDEEREIEQAFRQVTGQAPPPEPQPKPEPQDYLPTDFPELVLGEDFQPEDLPTELPTIEPPPKEEEELDFVDKAQLYFRKAADYCLSHQNQVLAVVCALTVCLIAGILAAFLIPGSDPYDGKILSNVYAAGVNLGGLTKAEAVDALQRATNQTYSQQDMVVNLSGVELRLKPEDTKVKLDVKAAVNAAYAYGRTGSQQEREEIALKAPTTRHYIGLLPYLSLDKAYIEEALGSYAQDSGSTLTQPNYGLEGPEPKLATDEFDKNAKPQTLVITLGTPGMNFDAQAVMNQILDAYSMNTFQVTVEGIEPIQEPEEVDVEAIFEELNVEPVNVSVDMQTFETIPGTYGYTFDLEKAKLLVAQGEYGQQIRIPMEFVPPEIVDEEVFFRDVLGSFETRYTSNSSRNTNLELACQAINGLVLNPGDRFSFNEALGKRSTEKGYKYAPTYAGPDKEEILGGGISQVASTLYNCLLLGDLEVTQRQNHAMPPSFIDYGLDAAISWGGADLAFVNNTNYPLKIQAEVSGGYVRVKLLGTDEKDYYVKVTCEVAAVHEPETEYKDLPLDNEDGYSDGDLIQPGAKGYTVKSYKIKYDKRTNAQMSRDYEATSTYTAVNKVVARVEEPTEPTQPETQPPETTAPTTPPTTEDTKPTESEPTHPTEESKPPETTETPPESSVPPSTTETPESSESTESDDYEDVNTVVVTPPPSENESLSAA